MRLKGILIRVIDIDIPDNLEESTIENENVDVFVKTDDGYTYTLSFATTKHLQFLMDKKEMDYYGPGYPFILVNKLTPEIITQAVNAFAEDEGYWLKVYHFGEWYGYFNESIFDQLKAKHIEEQEKLDEEKNS